MIRSVSRTNVRGREMLEGLTQVVRIWFFEPEVSPASLALAILKVDSNEEACASQCTHPQQSKSRAIPGWICRLL